MGRPPTAGLHALRSGFAQQVPAAGAELILFTPLFDQAEHAERLAAEVIPQLAQD
jgi:hypothetical protein